MSVDGSLKFEITSSICCAHACPLILRDMWRLEDAGIQCPVRNDSTWRDSIACAVRYPTILWPARCVVSSDSYCLWFFISLSPSLLSEGRCTILEMFCYRCCPQVWDVIMPQWMEAIKADVQPEELARFKVLLTWVFPTSWAWDFVHYGENKIDSKYKAVIFHHCLQGKPWSRICVLIWPCSLIVRVNVLLRKIVFGRTDRLFENLSGIQIKLPIKWKSRVRTMYCIMV